ncbi:hypothetical protein [Variovorax sp. OV700]|uniref:hypothetical protein n=1 Tax=Variovorax sp. OV700 TaxID=1882826 RepID=UPI00088A550B|nr:hypothetical protein [Variovorax sp. OV700]SDI41541.1 hypothetical protein SAMN05444748_10549 [Variovorax sp. OV700]
MKKNRPRIIALLMLVLAAAAGIAWAFAAARPALPANGAALEIRWHGNGIILQGAVRDAATQHALVEGATARLGGEADQVVDWLDIAPEALPVADAAALASLIRVGQEGWHLQRRAASGWLAVHSPDDARSAQAGELLQRAFGPDVTIRLVPLP